ncbi:hypothetical protein, partial [Peloplasma aerotolerans]
TNELIDLRPVQLQTYAFCDIFSNDMRIFATNVLITIKLKSHQIINPTPEKNNFFIIGPFHNNEYRKGI